MPRRTETAKVLKKSLKHQCCTAVLCLGSKSPPIPGSFVKAILGPTRPQHGHADRRNRSHAQQTAPDLYSYERGFCVILQTGILPPNNLGRLLNRGSNLSLLIKWGRCLFFSTSLSMSGMCRLDFGCSCQLEASQLLCLVKDYGVVKTRPGPSLCFKRVGSIASKVTTPP